MKTLVTGGGGFIGSHLAAHLAELGHDIRILDNFASGQRSNMLALPDDVELIEGDIQSYERAHNAVTGCDVVFHQAALPSVPRSVQDPLTSNATNITGTLNVLSRPATPACGGSSSPRRPRSTAAARRCPSARTSCRCRSRPTRRQSWRARATAAASPTSMVWRRWRCATSTFSVRARTRARSTPPRCPKFINALMAGERPTVFGDGEQSRDFAYVQNIVEANVLAMDAQGVAGQVFNVACGAAVTINELLDELRLLLDTDIEAEYVAPRPGDVRHSLADISRAKTALDYEPSVHLREGLRRTIEHFRQEGLPVREMAPTR